MAQGGFSGKVLIARERGGYKRVSVKSIDRRLWEPVRRKIKVGRAPARRRRFWVRKETRPVEYVRQFLYRLGDDGPTDYWTEDVVEVVNEPYDITNEQIDANLTDPARLRRMEARLITEHGGKSSKDGIMWTVPRDLKSGKGGARRLTPGQHRAYLAISPGKIVDNLRLEDMRRMARGGG